MAIPHYINEDNSDMRSIKPGWYAKDDDGNLSSGPFSSREPGTKAAWRRMAASALVEATCG